MPTSENQDLIQGSQQCGHIGADTAYYMMALEPDADALIEGGLDLLARDDGRAHWHHLVDMGLYMEAAYLDWKARGYRSACASMQVLLGLPQQFEEICQTWGSTLVEHDIDCLGRQASQVMDTRFDAGRTMAILERSLLRARDDLGTWTQQEFLAWGIDHQLGAGGMGRLDPARIAQAYSCDEASTPSTVRRVQAMLRSAEGAQKRVLKRSSRLLARIVGDEATRMFVGGQAIRVEGRHAVYEIRKNSPLSNSFGGFGALAVFAKDAPEVELCAVCIHTSQVPLLDHVASLVMHIQAGHEEDILRIGNANRIHKDAYALDWLAPYLPPHRPEPDVVEQLEAHDADEPDGSVSPGQQSSPMVTLEDMQRVLCPPSRLKQARKSRMAGLVGAQLVHDILLPYMDLVRLANRLCALGPLAGQQQSTPLFLQACWPPPGGRAC